MTSQRPRVWALGVALIPLILGGLTSAHSQPMSGEWKAFASFGEFILTVSADGSSITKIQYTFTNFQCGGRTYSGGMICEQNPPWSITSSTFSIQTKLDPFATDQTMTISGTFAPSGNQVSGTWSANVKGTIVSGNWGPVGPLVSVSEGSELPERVALDQNYPNPFNPLTTIRYGLPSHSHVTLTVFDTRGQEVGQLVNGDKEVGYHDVKFDASGLASGVYLYRIQACGYVETKRLLLIR